MLKVASSLLILLGAFAVRSAHSAPIQITALPYTIVTPGNYLLVSSVYATAPTGASITINVNVPGKVVLDLGTTHLLPDLVKPGPYSFDAIDVLAGEDVTIKNGDIATFLFNFYNGISAAGVSNLKIDNVTIAGCDNWAILFNAVNSSTVSNCTFVYGNAIEDLTSGTGNTYKNDNFVSGFGTNFLIGGDGDRTISNCKVTEVPTESP